MWLITAAFTCFFAAMAGWLWMYRKLEAHMRRHHPTRALELFPPSADHWRNDEEKGIAIQSAARLRLQEFIRSGAASALNDSELDRLVKIRAWIRRGLWLCAFTFAAMSLFFARFWPSGS